MSLDTRGNDKLQWREPNHESLMLQYYLLAGSDGKQPNSRGLTSGPHADALRTHSECLESDSEQSHFAWCCEEKQSYNQEGKSLAGYNL